MVNRLRFLYSPTSGLFLRGGYNYTIFELHKRFHYVECHIFVRDAGGLLESRQNMFECVTMMNVSEGEFGNNCPKGY